MKRLLQFFTLLALALVGGAQTMLASENTEWQTVWQTDFSSAPTGITYSVANGSVNISSGFLDYTQSGKGDRAINTGFTDNAFNVETNWKLEFDWGATCSNSNSSNVSFATNKGVAFTIEWGSYTSVATVKNASGIELTKSLTINGNRGDVPTEFSHFTIIGDTEKGILLTVTYKGTTVIDNKNVSETFGYPVTFNGTLGKILSHMGLDNIVFQTPKVAGFVAAPTFTVTGVNGTSRILELASITEGATILWSETAPDENETYVNWTEYNGAFRTSAAIIYAVAKQDANYSAITTVETGAGLEITLNAPSVDIIGFERKGEIYNPVYKFTSDQSSVFLTPSVTYSYKVNGGESVISDSYTASTTGKLVVTAFADGYASASTTIDISNNMFKRTFNYDFSSFTEHSATTVGNQTNVNSKGCQAYELAEDAVEGITINMNLLWALTADEAVGLYARVAKGSITYNGDFPEGSYAVFSNYGTPVVSSSATTSFALYGLALDMAVYVPVTTETITLPTSYTYSTFSSKYNLDFTDNADVEAYIAQVENDGVTVTLTKVEQVPAGEGVILKKTGDNTTAAVKVLASAEALSNNALVGVTEANTVSLETLAAAGNAYVLVSDEKFSKVSEGASGYISAGKAYLEYTPVAGASVNSLRISFGEPTAVADVEAKQETGDNTIYNVQGIRVSKPTAPGMYIMNGKAFIVK